MASNPKWQVVKRFANGKPCAWRAGDWLISLAMIDGLSMYSGYFKEEKDARFHADDPADVKERIK